MPRRRVKRSPYETILARDIKNEQKAINAEKRLSRSRGKRYRIDSKSRLYGPGTKALRARVGELVFGQAVDNFGGQLIARAAKAMDAALKKTRALRQAKMDRAKGILRAGGLSDEDLLRYRLRTFHRVSIPKQRIGPARKKGYLYAQERYINGKYRRTGVFFKTPGQANRSRTLWERRKGRAQIANALSITYRQASALAHDIEMRAVADLARFKKTKAFKSRPDRWKRGITEKRWRAASIAALYELLDVDIYK